MWNTNPWNNLHCYRLFFQSISLIILHQFRAAGIEWINHFNWESERETSKNSYSELFFWKRCILTLMFKTHICILHLIVWIFTGTKTLETNWYHVHKHMTCCFFSSVCSISETLMLWWHYGEQFPCIPVNTHMQILWNLLDASTSHDTMRGYLLTAIFLLPLVSHLCACVCVPFICLDV